MVSVKREAGVVEKRRVDVLRGVFCIEALLGCAAALVMDDLFRDRTAWSHVDGWRVARGIEQLNRAAEPAALNNCRIIGCKW